MKIKDELVKICERDGSLTPESVVKEASDPRSALHRFFEWDDTEAARRYRLAQAGFLIRRCKIVVSVAPEEVRRVREFVNIPAEKGRGEYVPVAEALNDDRRDVVMEQAVRELEAVRHKYEALVDIDAAWARARKRSRRKAS